MSDYRLIWNHCIAMRNELHFVKNMHFVWEDVSLSENTINWAAFSEFGTYRLCEQRRFRRACASAQSRQNLRYSPIQAVSQEEPSDRKPDPWPLWMAGHAQLKFVMTECSKTQIRLTHAHSKTSYYKLCNYLNHSKILSSDNYFMQLAASKDAC